MSEFFLRIALNIWYVVMKILPWRVIQYVSSEFFDPWIENVFHQNIVRMPSPDSIYDKDGHAINCPAW